MRSLMVTSACFCPASRPPNQLIKKLHFEFELASDKEIKMIENKLDNRPRKLLVFKIPAEVFYQS